MSKLTKTIKLFSSHIDWINAEKIRDQEFGFSRLVRKLLNEHMAKMGDLQ